ncbi:MAG: UDP-N-acetylglucosamine 2-epimerase (hydrolyzing) [Muribaculaceae bacterium]|nr:UDP-N-acetylglucosamine 2-epimerase (hydrolyzing) [Muribaculaceae bacterium]
MKIAIATGTRADWGLLQPLAEALRERGAEVAVMATHQHLIPRMGHTLEEIRRDGFEPVALIPAGGEPSATMALAAAGFSVELPRVAPDALVVLGDRCEMLGVTSAALLTGIPVIHIAGGTVSEGAFDDSIRHAITKMATLHFPETDLCARRILQMGENPAHVVTAGALGVENALKTQRLTRNELVASLGGWDPGERFLVVTLHAATLAEGEPLTVQRNMLDTLQELPEEWRFIITYPNSDVDPAPLIAGLESFARGNPGRVKVVPSLGKVRYLSAVALSQGVVGNSSSALVEVPSLGVPSLDIGIRQQGREHGPSVIRSGTGREDIERGLERLLSEEMRLIAARRENPYSRPDTAALMADTILNFDFHPYPVKTFHLCENTSI